ncbi:MAG TPA: tetratricopeptide repeat protein, partial [Acetobacteraceae bacterium]
MTATLEQARAAHQAHDLDAAETAYRALLSPDAVEALHGLGLVRLARDEPTAALTLIEAAHRLVPEGRSAHNLAVVLKRLGRVDDAVARAHEAVSQHPDYVPAWFGLAELLTESGARGDASAVLVAFADRALRSGDMALAREATNRLVALDADHASLLWLANLLHMAGHDDDARRVLAIRLRAAPDDIGAGLTRAMAQLTRVHADEADLARRRADYAAELTRVAGLATQATPRALSQAAAVIGLAQPFLLSYHGKNDRALQRCYGGIIDRLAAAQGFPPAPASPPLCAGEKIRVGFASAHLHMHSVSKTHGGWITELDRSRFAVFGYQFSAARDAVSERFAACCESFVRG